MPGDKLEGKVVDLKERGEYQFRVLAVNKAGCSPASEPTPFHVVKHKNCEYIAKLSSDTILIYFFNSETTN